MNRTVKFHVLMAGNYDIARGAKIDFHFETEKLIYIASCEGKSFGIANEMLGGEKEDLERLGASFSGVALNVDHNQHLMEVKVAAAERSRV